MIYTRFLVLFFLFQFLFLSAQDRNEKVRNINEVVNLISLNSNLNNKYYYDALYFTIAIVDYENNKNNFFKTFKGNFINNTSINNRLLDYENKGYQNNGFFENKLKEKNSSLKKIKIAFLNKDSYLSSLKLPFEDYLNKTDSLLLYRNQIIKYLKKKKYKKDLKLTDARKILNKIQIYFDKCTKTSENFYSVLETIYLTQLPLNDSQAVIKNAAAEMELTTNLLSSWQKKIANNDNSLDNQFALEIQTLFNKGIAKDSLFFSKSKYYNDDIRNLSINPANQYLNFYYGTSVLTEFKNFSSIEVSAKLENTIKNNEIPTFLNKNYCKYNDFINLYNTKINSFNLFTSLADPLINLSLEELQIAKKYLDLDSNTILKKPELMYKFEFIDSTFLENPSPKLILSDKGKFENAIPHHLIYLLDASTSMREEKRLNRLKENTKYIVNFQSEKDRISMVTFSESATIILKNEPCNDKISIDKKIEAITAGGYTNFNEAATVAFDLAVNNKLQSGKNTIILITDGVFEMNKSTEVKLKSLKKDEIDFCLIYIGPKENKNYEEKFKAIIEKINGRFYNADEKSLRSILVKEASE